jgi:B12-binding domain/radical SAM domain protein
MKTDLILLHAPAIYDFRERPALFGPISDLVPATPIFDIYPMGLSTIAEYLERNGYFVRTFNLAFLMLRSKKFDVEKAIAGMDPKIFGIDLHWMPHSHGAIEVARIIKRLHPDTPVVLGGHSSSIFHEELLEYDCIDFVIRGDSTEEPFRQLMDAVSSTAWIGGKVADAAAFASIPNLTWRDASGAVVVNDLTYSPPDFNLPSLDFSYNMKSVIRYRDLFGGLPFKQWLSVPMSASIICRGCTRNCVTCGGSATSYKKYFGRSKVAYRDPELIVREIAHASKFIPGSVFLLNDFLQAGDDYTRTLIKGLGTLNLKQSLGFELFSPPSEEMLDLMSEHLNDWSIEVSVESHDDEIRKRFGKGHYTTQDIEDNVAMALDKGVTRYDLFYLAGIPGQDAQSVLDTSHYIRGLYERMNNDKRLLAFVAPMTPFLDVGSIAYDHADEYGYKLKATTVEEHRQLLTKSSWKEIMNYERLTLPTDELGEVIYESASIVNDIKEEIGLVTPEEAKVLRDKIVDAKRMMDKVDHILTEPQAQRDADFGELSDEVAVVTESTLYDFDELNWPSGIKLGHVLQCVWLWITEESKQLFTWGHSHADSKIHKQYEADMKKKED